MTALLSTATEVHAEGCEPWVARIISVQGQVLVERSGAPRAQPAGLNDTVCPGDRVRVGPLGRAALQLANDAETPIRLGEGTTLIFPAPEPEKPFLLKLIEGVLHVFSREPQALTIETPIVAAYTEGTEFVLGVSKSEAELWVFEGRVRYANPQGELQVASGEGALARLGQAPVRRILVKPREAVEWALYYPPLVDPRPESYPPGLRPALSAYRANDLPAAFAALERVPAKDRDGRYLLLRAGLLMSVGRVAKAEADLAQAERADPRSGEAAALRSVIALVRDQKDDALRLAESGAGLDPNSPLPQAALSYAYQGRFEIEKALEHAKRAVELTPEDALLWARVSELELSRGDLDAALKAAQKAEALSPALARTQTVLGFAYLTRIEVDKAKTAFERAIRGDPADPLPRLGMGLAKIRDGDLSEGTREIETAASLDPNNSLVRSYLGKAYYEQKREGLALSEYEQAKLLDPKDPTPWFYDAIHKQTTNRPVEALHDLQRAIELNDNRAVYRSKLLLDQDLAARSAAVGRIYRDLGFEQLALVEGWKSVNTDPSDYSAHRLLADSYSVLPRHNLARVSELLQSQLLQPLNITPLQANLAENDLLLLEDSGPSAPAFNEFNPLFTRDRLTLQTSGVVENNDTFGDEVTHSGLSGTLAYSLGQFHFETDGFRGNNRLTQDLYNVFLQKSLSPTVSLQAEYRHRETEHGDLDANFDLESFNSFFRRTFRADTGRFGAHYAPAPHSDWLLSFIYQAAATNQTNVGSRTFDDTEGYLGELQHIFRAPSFSFVMGAGYDSGTSNQRCDSPLDDPFCSTAGSDDLVPQSRMEFRIRHANGYVYSYIRFPKTVTWTVGLSFDSVVDDIAGDADQPNPKLGAILDLGPQTTIRVAAFRTLQRSLITGQTLEPTQVAGFNQFFDDPNGTESRRYGAAVDHKFSKNLYGGIETSKRDLAVPLRDGFEEDWEEELYRAYLDWTPTSGLAAALSYQYEQFANEKTDFPRNTRTHTLPVTLSYFHPNGIFGGLRLTYVNQHVDLINQNVDLRPEDTDSDRFAVVDAEVGYRLPNRYGIIRLGVRNLFNQDFDFQGVSGRTSTTRDDVPPFFPDTTLAAQITLAF